MNFIKNSICEKIYQINKKEEIILKIVKVLPVVVGFSLMFSVGASAKTNSNAGSSSVASNSHKKIVHVGERPSLSGSETLATLTNDKEETKELKQIHKKIILSGLAHLKSDGEIVIDATASDVGVNQDLFNKYLENMQNVNSVIRKDGGTYFDKHFNIKIKPSSETSKTVPNNSTTLDNNSANLVTSQSKITLAPNMQINPGGGGNEYPVLEAYKIADKNWQGLYNDWAALALGVFGNPTTAMSYVTSEWVKKVRPYGVWDYKRVSGYTPNTKKWDAIVKGGLVEVQNSDWFGNYNYGYTGKLIFPLSVLYTGGNVVSEIRNGAPDNFAAHQEIKEGYTQNTH